MTIFLKNLLRVKTLLLLIICLHAISTTDQAREKLTHSTTSEANAFSVYLDSNAPASNDNKAIEDTQLIKTSISPAATPIMTDMLTRKELIALFDQIAAIKCGRGCGFADKLADWLVNCPYRAPKNLGKQSLDNSDFESLHDYFGNAFAFPQPAGYYTIWALNETGITDIKNCQCRGIISNGDDWGDMPTTMDAKEYATAFALLVDQYGNKNNAVGKMEFVRFMLDRR